MRRSPKHRAEPAGRPRSGALGGHAAKNARAVASTAASLAVALAPSLLGGAPAHAALAAAVTAGYPQRAAQVGVTIVTLQTKDKSAADAAALDVTAYRNAVASASSYWSAMSAGRISLRVTKVVAGFKTSASSGDDFAAIMSTVSRELGWTPGSSTVLLLAVPRDDVLVSGSKGNLGAGWAASQTSGRILLPRPSSFTGPVTAHEMGHILGVGHANTLQCSNGAVDAVRAGARFADTSCSTRGYGDGTDLMGISRYSQPQLNAYLYEYGGMGRGDEIANIGTPGAASTYTLTPWAGGAPRRAAKFKDPSTGEWYYLQYRAPVGYDAPTALAGNQGVQIIKGGLDESESLLIPPTTKPFSGVYAANLAWQPGQTFTTAGGTRVSINAAGAASATVSITAKGAVPENVAALMDAKAAQFGLGPGFGGIGTLRDGGLYHMYQRGAVVWTPSAGARVSKGAIRGAWQRLGFENGSLGFPTSDEIGGLKDGGVYQMYQGGAIVWSPQNGAFESKGAIRGAWQRLGLEDGKMGYPTSGEAGGLRNGGVSQMYEGGAIVWSPQTGAFESMGAIRGAWQRLGLEKGRLGYPTSGEVGGLRNGGVSQMYEGGAIVWSPQTGAFESTGPLRDRWLRLGAQNGDLGYPTSAEITGLKGGGVSQSYEGGAIVFSPATGAFESVGAIRAAWSSLGSQNGKLGYPTSGEAAGLRGGGVSQSFQGGTIVWSPRTGAHESLGAIRGVWTSMGAQDGALGYPTSGEIGGLKNGGVYQQYEGGAIMWSPQTGAHESMGAIRAAWGSMGYENGKMGYPTSGEYAISGGVAQNFEGGRIEWNRSSGIKVIASVGAASGTVTPIPTPPPAPAPTPSPAPAPTPPPAVNTETAAQIQSMVRQTAVQMGVDPALALAVAEQESSFRQNVTSPVGAIGVMQIMPANRDWLAGMTGRPTLDLNKTADNIAGGVAMLRWLTAEAKNLDEAIAGYYQGLGSVQSRGMYDDTKVYVAQVKARMAKF
ncbi:transglycosylase SLT domain-containing protein [Sinomonas soli]